MRQDPQVQDNDNIDKCTPVLLATRESNQRALSSNSPPLVLPGISRATGTACAHSSTENMLLEDLSRNDRSLADPGQPKTLRISRTKSSKPVGSTSSRWGRWAALNHFHLPSKEWVSERLNLQATVAALLPEDVDLRAMATTTASCQTGSSEYGLTPRFQVLADGLTTWCGYPRRLWIVKLANTAPNDFGAVQLRWLQQLLEQATWKVKPETGPWLWPLHRRSFCTALLSSFALRTDEDKQHPCLREFLWGLRLFPPPGGPKMEEELRKHYGAAISYCFAWANLYLRGLWFLTVPFVLVSWTVGARPGDIGSSVAWNMLQVWVLIWSQILVHAGHSRRLVLSVGGCKTEVDTVSEVADGANVNAVWCARELIAREIRTASEKVASIPKNCQQTVANAANEEDRYLEEGIFPTDNPISSSPGAHTTRRLSQYPRHLLETAQDEALRRERSHQFFNPTAEASPAASNISSASRVAAENAFPGRMYRPRTPQGITVGSSPFANLTPRARRYCEVRAAVKVQSAIRGALARKNVKDKFQRALNVVRISAIQRLQLRKRLNPEYKPPRSDREAILWNVFSVCISVGSIILFTTVAVFFLTLIVQLNAYLAYVWGRCLDEEVIARAQKMGHDCRDPQFEHGFVGWLAEVSSDILMAILFDVTLCELSKVLASCLVRLRNYRLLYDARWAKVMLSLIIEVFSKVGLFIIIGFIFLPRWSKTLDREMVEAELGELPWAPEVSANATSPWRNFVPVHCAGLPDYELCRAIGHCSPKDAGCCAGTLLCVAQMLDYPRRRVLFEKSVKGPFCVAPFVRILITVLLPWVVGKLDEFVTVDSRDELSDEENEAKTQSVCCRCCRATFSPIVRILSLIFNLTGGNVGGCRYIYHGWPFGMVQVSDTESPTALKGEDGPGSPCVSADRVLKGALDQVALKMFDPLDELLELKMNFIFVCFFAPIMPSGLLPTIIARLLEVRTKATKLFFVRRRQWPDEARLLHDTQDCFARIAATLAVFWHVGLFLVSYNDMILEWGKKFTVFLWLFSSIASAVALNFLGWFVNTYFRSCLQHLRWWSCFAP